MNSNPFKPKPSRRDRRSCAFISTFGLEPIYVTNQATIEGVSLPSVATRLRRWAMERKEVVKVVIGHTSQEYTVAVQICEYDDRLVEQIRQEASRASNQLGSIGYDVFVLSAKHADAPMFHRRGSYIVYDLADNQDARSMA
ncbi:MAG: hypothetical protein IT445_06245 [Phycisphaeraceae bacterium]|nr:hypothetical protein [Phycisphaeraceae bacterium]